MRALVFDLDGTLLQYTREYEELLGSTFQEVSGDIDPVWLETYSEVFFEEFVACNPDPVERAFEATEAPGDSDRFADLRHETEVDATELPDSALEDLERLSWKFGLAILTNGLPDWQRGKVATHGIGQHVDTVVASYDVGEHKPGAAPYREVEQRLDADRFAMIGDSDDDIEGGRAVGWDTLRYEGGRLRDVPAELSWR